MMKPTVVVEKLEIEKKLLIKQITNSFQHISFEKDFKQANAVLIKPNLTYPVYKEGVTTRKVFIECLVAALREINTSTKILIGEGEGGYNSFSMSDSMRNMGYYELEKLFSNVKIINFSELPSSEVELDTPDGNYIIKLPQIFFDDVDFSITCPLPKVHCMTKLTLSYKNQWGCIPDTMRLKNHFKFDSIISKISDKLKFKYAFLDGLYGLNNNGPMVGDPIRVDWFVASNSLGAFDRILSEMMGFDYRKIGHLKIAEDYGYIPPLKEIKIIGRTETLSRKFNLKRNFWNYPALAAFHSKHLTHLVYFSKWAKLLHDIMYTFRKKPINI